MKKLTFNLTKTDIAKATKLAEDYEKLAEKGLQEISWCAICIITIVLRKKIPNAHVGLSVFTTTHCNKESFPLSPNYPRYN